MGSKENDTERKGNDPTHPTFGSRWVTRATGTAEMFICSGLGEQFVRMVPVCVYIQIKYLTVQVISPEAYELGCIRSGKNENQSARMGYERKGACAIQVRYIGGIKFV